MLLGGSGDDEVMSGAKIGSLIGCAGGLVFFLVNAGGQPGSRPGVLRAVGVALFFVACLVLTLPARAIGRGAEPSRGQIPAYGWTVLAEVALISTGSRVLAGPLEQPGPSLPWVAIVLGLHFVVFRVIFAERVFAWLGGVMLAAGVVAMVMALAGADTPRVALVAGILPGLLMFVAVGWAGWVGRPEVFHVAS